MLAALALPVLLSPWVVPDIAPIDLPSRLAPPGGLHVLGTDELGRDLLDRLLAGGRVSLAVALATALLASGIGAAIGLAAGWLGGRWDDALMRLTDGLMALPLLPLLIVLAAIDPTRLGLSADMAVSESVSIVRLILIIALVGWTGTARLVRAQTLSVKARDHVRAAVALGVPPVRIILRHIAPQVASPVLVAGTVSVGSIILMESALSFLGLGIRPPVASWGNMLSGAMDVVWSSPLLALWPGLAIFLTVLSVSILGDGLNALFAPHDTTRRKSVNLL